MEGGWAEFSQEHSYFGAEWNYKCNFRNLGFDLEIIVREISTDASPWYGNVEITFGPQAIPALTSKDGTTDPVLIACAKLARRLPLANRTALSLASEQSLTLILGREGIFLPSKLPEV